jgi:hypothetical protein
VKKIKYPDIMDAVIQILSDGATPSELKEYLREEVGYKTKYMSLYGNIIHPAYKLGLLEKKGERYYAIPELKDCKAWRNPKFYYNPQSYYPTVRSYAREHQCSKEIAFIKLHPDKVVDVISALLEIIKKGGKPDPDIGVMRLLKVVKKIGLSNILKKSDTSS